MTNSDTSNQGTNYDKYVQTQVSLITGPTIQTRVWNDGAIRHLPIIEKADDPLALLSKYVFARNQPGSELVSVSCRLPDANADVSDRAANREGVFWTTTLSRRRSRAAGYARRFRTTYNCATGSCRQQSDQIAALRKSLDMPESSVGMEFGPSETMSFNENLAKAQSDKTTAEKDEERIRNALAEIDTLEATFQSQARCTHLCAGD